MKTHVGGQALLEGIMMRGKLNWAVAVRESDGSIYTEEHDLASGRPENSWLSWPVIRGCTAFVESLAIGYKALSIAAEHIDVGEDDEEPEGEEEAAEELPVEDDSSFEAVAADDEALDDVDGGEVGESGEPAKFSWMNDFGNPDEMIDALGAQRKLEVVSEPMSDEEPVRREPSRESSDHESESASEDDSSENGLSKGEMAAAMVIGTVLGIVLFVVAPAFLSNLIIGEYDSNTLAWNLTDGVLRIAVFVLYIWLIGLMSDIRRMFCYHGAEHKTIHCYEHGLPLTPENARQFPRLHVRCGTAFLIMVMIIAIFVYSVVPLNGLIEAWHVPDGAPKLTLVIIVRILLLPLIAGLAYEVTVKWAGSHPENPLVKVVLWPGMQMQRLTTKEPDDGMLECAIAAMNLVLDREKAAADGQASANVQDEGNSASNSPAFENAADGA